MKNTDVQSRLKSIRERLDAYASQPLDQLYQVRGDLALLRAVRDTLLERLEADEPPAFRRHALTLYREARVAMEDDPARAGAKLAELGQLLERGVAADADIDALLAQSHQLIQRCVSLEDLRIRGEKSVPPSELLRFLRSVASALRSELPAADVARVLDRINVAGFGGRLQLTNPDSNGTAP